jgi:hypothetical protein
MANTSILKNRVEPFVRNWLAAKFGQPFQSHFLEIIRVNEGARTHEFDAVSEDRKIICGIKASSWKTESGKRGAGKIAEAYMEIYFLDHVEAEQKYLVLTDTEFFQNLQKHAKGRLAKGIDLLHCELPPDLKVEVSRMREESRAELRPPPDFP